MLSMFNGYINHNYLKIKIFHRIISYLSTYRR